MYATIEIDRSKCGNPYSCKKCLQVCLPGVFWIQPMIVEREKPIDPNEAGAARLTAYYRDKCTGCNDCVEVCPVKAINISYPELEVEK